jgi:hypothetical protein
MQPEGSREERLKNFFSSPKAPAATIAERIPLKKSAASPSVSVAGKKASTIFFLLGGISILSLLGVGLFLFLPKAEIHAVPHKALHDSDLQFDGRVSGDMSGDNGISVRLVEKEETVSFGAAATGKSGASNQKARGTAVIYNEFSSEPQSLVATTRLETPDGKLFRLVEGVTVPGMTDVSGKKEPGAIEADVIADQVGAEYNIEPTTFTIPGFKGGPKYAKFSAKSMKSMSGGGGGSDICHHEIDMDKAESDAKDNERGIPEGSSGELDGRRCSRMRSKSSLKASCRKPHGCDIVRLSEPFKIRAFIFSEQQAKSKPTARRRWRVVFADQRDAARGIARTIPGTVRFRVHAIVESKSIEKLHRPPRPG